MSTTTALHLQLAAPALGFLVALVPVLIWDIVRTRRARRAAFRKAQAEKITVPHQTCTLYRSLERLERR